MINNVVSTRQVSALVRKALPTAAVFFCCLCYAVFLSDKTMPITEGWYTEYASLINSGQIPYRDFAYLMPPAYLYTISWITAILGYNLIILRIIGAFLFACIAVAAYAIFSRVFSKFAAIPATFACMFFMQSGAGEVFYDYIYFCNLLVYVSIACLVCYVSDAIASGQDRAQTRSWVKLIEALVCGVSVSLACLTKQSTGIMLFGSIIVYFIGVAVCFGFSTHIRRFAVLFITGFVVPILVACTFLLAHGAFSQFVNSCITSAVSAKGGLGEELFSWIVEGERNFRTYAPLSIAVLLCTTIGMMCDRSNSEKASTRSDLLFSAVTIVAALALPFICYEWETFSRMVVQRYDTSAPLYSSALVPVILLVLLAGKAILSRIRSAQNMDTSYLPLLALCATATSVVWAVGMSGGLGESQVCLGTGMGLGFMLSAFQRTRFYSTTWVVSLLGLSVLICCGVSRKYCEMYNWWGLSEGSVWEQTESVDIPILQGIHMSSKDADCYSTVYDFVKELDLERGEIFAFPHCPIFYRIADSQPATYSIVQWFDVSSKEAIDADIETLTANHPDVLLLCEIPETTMAGHETAFNTYQTREMQSFLFNLANTYYESVSQCDLGNGYIVHIYILSSALG